MVVAGKFKDLREQTLKNRRDKKFWTQMLKQVNGYTPKRRGGALRRSFR